MNFTSTLSRIGRGSERGDREHWFFETYELTLEAGDHVFVARVWSQGDHAAFAQMSVMPGFLLAPQEAELLNVLGTGVAPWEARMLGGYSFTNPQQAWGTGDNLCIDGKDFDWGFASGQGAGWKPVRVLHAGLDAASRVDTAPVQMLMPATLPAMLDRPIHPGTVRHVQAVESIAGLCKLPVLQSQHLQDESPRWQQWISGNAPITVPPHSRRRVLIDLDDYYCGFPSLVTSGGSGATVRVDWQESLFNEPNTKSKGNRDQIEGKYFVTIWSETDGIGDVFLPDGGDGRLFETLWWQCGRYVQIAVETMDEPLTLQSWTLRETRYPLDVHSHFAASDPRLQRLFPIGLRALQMCSHETYMDCPYFEQLQYIGDTRLQALITYALSSDDRLPRKALRMFDASRVNSGLTQSRYPSRSAANDPHVLAVVGGHGPRLLAVAPRSGPGAGTDAWRPCRDGSFPPPGG